MKHVKIQLARPFEAFDHADDVPQKNLVAIFLFNDPSRTSRGLCNSVVCRSTPNVRDPPIGRVLFLPAKSRYHNYRSHSPASAKCRDDRLDGRRRRRRRRSVCQIDLCAGQRFSSVCPCYYRIIFRHDTRPCCAVA